MADWSLTGFQLKLTHSWIVAAQSSYYRAKLSTLRPVRISATICSLNPAGYGVLVLGMKNTLLHQVKSVHQTGGTANLFKATGYVAD